MKKIILWIKLFLQRLLHFLFNLFKPISKRNETQSEKQNKKVNFESERGQQIQNTPITDLPTTNGTEELKRKPLEPPLYKKQEIQKIFYDFLEKTLCIKIQELSKEKQEELEKYTIKTIDKIEPIINKQKQKDKEKVEKTLKENLERDLEKKDLSLEKLILLTLPNPQKMEMRSTLQNSVIEEQTKRTEPSKVEPVITPAENRTTIYKNQSIPIINAAPEMNENKTEFITETTTEEKENLSTLQEESEKTLTDLEEIQPSEIENLEKRSENEQDLYENTIINTNEKPPLMPEIEITPQKLEEIKPKVEAKKIEPIIIPIEIEFTKIETENKKIIEEVKAEYNKEEFVDKEYELVEELIEKRINDIEKTLQKPLTPEQKIRLKKELEKLQETQKQLYLYKEKDIEELRISLEENIPASELVLVNEKLKNLVEDEQIDKNKLLLQNIEYKSQQELKKIELILIKDYYKKALRRSLYFSFPFIKNKHFRRFVAGLFVFRTFGFLKHLLFQIPDEYEPIDLSSIQKGSDALTESIAITEKNIESFQELKNKTLMKYPELLNDKNFTKDINKLEESLMTNYEKLLKQDESVKKYFDTSKKLIRSRKYSI